MEKYLELFGPPAMTAAASIIAAYVVTRRRVRERGGIDAPARVMAIIALGFGFALSWVMFVTGQLTSDGTTGLETGTTLVPFVDLPTTPGQVPRPWAIADREADAIVGGVGPRDWQTGRSTVFVGNVRYLRTGDWVEVVVPDSTSERSERDSCLTKTAGRIKVLGFSLDRSAALVEYTAPDEAGGSSCDTGTHYFHPLPQRQGNR